MDLKIYASLIDSVTTEQIQTMADSFAFQDSKIRIMPDCHKGAGSVIGFTGTYTDKIIPFVIGVDISCGMLCVPMGKMYITKASLRRLDETIHRFIPSGRNVGKAKSFSAERIVDSLRCKKYLKNIDWLLKSEGTLGGGNHFIELDKDESENYYLIIHTGSRNLGKQVAEYYQDKAFSYCRGDDTRAKERMELIARCKKEHREKDISVELREFDADTRSIVSKIPHDLSFLTGSDMDDYLHDMKLCQEFADANRKSIHDRISLFWKDYYSRDAKVIRDYESQMFTTLHNYIDLDSKIIRKGAVSAKSGERLVIPMNMRDGVLLCTGKGNSDWNYSAPHGAGRVLSRASARAKISLKEFEDSMEGVYTTSVSESTLDESPMVYKPVEAILNCIGDTVTVDKILKPVYNYKSGDDE